MKEAQWLKTKQKLAVLRQLKGTLSSRKFRLFACACCRRIWDLISPKWRTRVEVAEQFVDRKASASELDAQFSIIFHNECKHANLAALQTCAPTLRIVDNACNAAINAKLAAMRTEETAAQHALLADIAGNPFRQAVIDPAWLAWNDRTIPRLARAAYEERDLPAGTLSETNLAILADALEEAGCNDAGMLTHLRSPGPHVRGCWALDRLLGRD
jgi:hypothetical protein